MSNAKNYATRWRCRGQLLSLSTLAFNVIESNNTKKKCNRPLSARNIFGNETQHVVEYLRSLCWRYFILLNERIDYISFWKSIGVSLVGKPTFVFTNTAKSRQTSHTSHAARANHSRAELLCCEKANVCARCAYILKHIRPPHSKAKTPHRQKKSRANISANRYEQWVANKQMLNTSTRM